MLSDALELRLERLSLQLLLLLLLVVDAAAAAGFWSSFLGVAEESGAAAAAAAAGDGSECFSDAAVAGYICGFTAGGAVVDG